MLLVHGPTGPEGTRLDLNQVGLATVKECDEDVGYSSATRRLCGEESMGEETGQHQVFTRRTNQGLVRQHTPGCTAEAQDPLEHSIR